MDLARRTRAGAPHEERNLDPPCKPTFRPPGSRINFASPLETIRRALPW